MDWELKDVGEYDFLIDSYPDCLQVENKNKKLPLHLAVLARSIEVVELICKKYQIAAKKKLEQEKQHVVSLKEQVEHAEKIAKNSKIALKEEKKRAAALPITRSVRNNLNTSNSRPPL